MCHNDGIAATTQNKMANEQDGLDSKYADRKALQKRYGVYETKNQKFSFPLSLKGPPGERGAARDYLMVECVCTWKKSHLKHGLTLRLVRWKPERPTPVLFRCCPWQDPWQDPWQIFAWGSGDHLENFVGVVGSDAIGFVNFGGKTAMNYM